MKTPSLYSTSRSVLTLLAALLIGHSADAASYTWRGSAGSTDWATTGNWSSLPATSTATFLFFTSSNASSSNTLTNTLTSSTFQIGNITFEAGAPAYTMTGSTFRLIAATDPTTFIANNSSNTQTFNNLINMGRGVTVTGASVTLNDLNVFNASRILTNNVSAGNILTLGSISLADTAAARTLTISGSGNTVFSGTIANNLAAPGNLSFNSTHTGTATLNAASTYTGATTLSGGSFILGNDAAFSTSTLAMNGVSTSASAARVLANTTTLGAANTFTGTNNIEFSGLVTANGNRTINNLISGPGVLTFSNTLALSSSASENLVTFNGSGTTAITGVITNGTGGATAASLTYSSVSAGTLILSGSNTYGGTTTISAGTMLVQNTAGSATGSGAVTLTDGAILGGNGTIAGTLAANGNLTPGIAGDATVTLNLNGSVTMSATANTTFDIDGLAAGAFDVIANDGDAITFDGDLVFDLTGSYSTGNSWTAFSGFSSYSAGTFDTVTLTGSYSGSLVLTGDLWQGPVGGLVWKFDESTGVLSVVPEPASLGLLGMGLTALWWRSRSRRNQHPA